MIFLLTFFFPRVFTCNVNVLFRLQRRVSNVVGSNKVLGLALERPLEKVLAALEHAFNQVFGDTMILEVEEADILASLADLTRALFRVRSEEAKVHHWDSDVGAGGSRSVGALVVCHGGLRIGG